MGYAFGHGVQSCLYNMTSLFIYAFTIRDLFASKHLHYDVLYNAQ